MFRQLKICETLAILDGIKLVKRHCCLIPTLRLNRIQHLLEKKHIHNFKIYSVHPLRSAASTLSATLDLASHKQKEMLEKEQFQVLNSALLSIVC